MLLACVIVKACDKFLIYFAKSVEINPYQFMSYQKEFVYKTLSCYVSLSRSLKQETCRKVCWAKICGLTIIFLNPPCDAIKTTSQFLWKHSKLWRRLRIESRATGAMLSNWGLILQTAAMSWSKIWCWKCYWLKIIRQFAEPVTLFWKLLNTTRTWRKASKSTTHSSESYFST